VELECATDHEMTMYFEARVTKILAIDQSSRSTSLLETPCDDGEAGEDDALE
jgi:hypothetical protein